MSWTITGSEKTPVDPQFGSVQLLLHGEGASIIDSSRFARSLTVNGAVTSTAQKKYGNSSIFFDGINDSVVSPTEAFNIRTSPFTIEAWIYPFANLASKDIAFFGAGSNDFYLVTVSNTLYVGDGVSNNVSVANAATSLPSNQWKHLALAFDGTTYRVFIEGQVVGSSTTLLKNYSSSSIVIGNNTTRWMDGYLDEVRISSVCRYTSNFTPPTAPFPDI